MTQITLIHPSLNKTGGAEKVLLEIIRVLNESGYETCLYTIDRVNWDRLERKRGTQSRPSKEISYSDEVNHQSPVGWGISTLIYLWMLWRAQQEGGITLNNYGEVFPFISDISYIHSHPLYTNDENTFTLPLWPHSGRLYRYIFDKLRPRTSQEILSNSTYTARQAITIGLNTTVIYPFVKPVKITASKRGDVLTVSRISWGKSLGTLFKVAVLSRGLNFRVMGEVSQNSMDIVKEITRSKRFEFSANPTREDIEKSMAESSVYFSTQPNETFGIAILEAMSAGCVPLVYRGGGPWLDIFQGREEVGLSYIEPEEAAEKLRMILRDEEMRTRMREKAMERVGVFSVDRFERSIKEFIRTLEPRPRSERRFVKVLRWISQKRERYGL